MNPYWNTTIIAGFEWDGNTFMNSVDQYGTKYNHNYLVSGFALYFAGPILEKSVPKDCSTLSKERAIQLIDDVFRVLFYRDSMAGDTIYYGILEKTGNEEPAYGLLQQKLQTNWEHELFKTSHNQRYHPTA
jgi:20S proteasome alpha/beta subunit